MTPCCPSVVLAAVLVRRKGKGAVVRITELGSACTTQRNRLSPREQLKTSSMRESSQQAFIHEENKTQFCLSRLSLHPQGFIKLSDPILIPATITPVFE